MSTREYQRTVLGKAFARQCISLQAEVMHLMHLGLPVRDEQRSRRFYETYFGFDPATAQRYGDGTVTIRNADGFDLALHGGQEIGPLPAFLHFGFRLPSPDAVRGLLARTRAAGIDITEEHDEPAYVAFKCSDPDGHQVETYWESAARPLPQHPGPRHDRLVFNGGE